MKTLSGQVVLLTGASGGLGTYMAKAFAERGAHLRERTEQFIRERNQTARPFKWTFRGYPLQTGAS